jgi:hypothetical protein
VRVLWSGVDTLEASFRGRLLDALCDWLDELKGFAQVSNHPQRFTGFDEVFVVSPSGLKPWRWVLAGEDMQLRLSNAPNVPTASVRLSSLGLAFYGAEALYRIAEEHVSDLGSFMSSGVSRLDLFADVQGFEPDGAVMEGMACPAIYRGTHAAGSIVQTFQYGKGEIVARVYNKTAEIATSGKSWLHEVWRSCDGYDPEADVWRVEFQLRRSFLKTSGGCETDRVLTHRGDLWLSGLKWCELRIPQGANKSRWPLHPAWEMLAALEPGSSPHPRIKALSYLESFESVVPQVAGLLVSAGSAVGMHNLESALEAMSRCVREYIENSGEPFPDRVRRRTLKRLAAR